MTTARLSGHGLAVGHRMGCDCFSCHMSRRDVPSAAEALALRDAYRAAFPLHRELKPCGGVAQRLNWRIKERFGPGFDRASDAEIRKYLRQVSWRRAK